MRSARLSRVGALVLVGLGLVVGARPAGLRGGAGAEPEVSRLLTLDNGLSVFLLERHALPLVHIVAAVNCGTKDETPRTSGLAHLLEHYALFRGTETRSGAEVGREIREHGAYYNAQTSQDLTLFELSLPAAQAEFGLANLKDILFAMRITDEGVDAERGVILKELNLIADDPVRRAAGVVAEKLFGSHPYALPVQGRRESIETLTARDLESFAKAYFVPGNTSLAVVGDLALADMERLVRATFGSLPAVPFRPPVYPLAAPPAEDSDLTLEMDVTKAYCLIGMPGPDYNHPDQFVVDVLAQVLGRGLNPMLYASLRANRDLAESASMSYTTLARGGLILATLTCDPKNLAGAKREALRFLRGSRTLDFGPDDIAGEDRFYAFDYITSAKNQLRFQVFRGQERGLNVAEALARYLLLQNKAVDRNYLRSVESVSTSDLRQAAGRYLSGGRKVIVSVVPAAKGKDKAA